MPSEGEPSTPRVSSTSRGARLRAGFTLIVSGLAVWFLWRVLSDVGLPELGDRLRSASLALTAAAVALTVLRFLLLAFRWELLARREAPVGLSQMARVLMAGNLLALITPAVRIAGPILRAYYLSKETGRPRARFYGTIVADQTANFTIFAIVTALGGAMVGASRRGPAASVASVASAQGHMTGLSWLSAAAMLLALVGGLALSYAMLVQVSRGRPSHLGRLLGATLGAGPSGGRRARTVGWWEDMMRALAGAIVGTGAWWPAIGISVVAYALGVGVQALAFAAIDSRVGLIEVSFAIAAAGFVQTMAAAPGGPGVTEASLIGAFLFLGLDGESAAAGVLLARIVNYGVLLPWGGYAFISLQRRYGMPRRAAGEAACEARVDSAGQVVD